MRILSASFVHEFPERIVNIHPSLLPAFPGSEAIRQAWDYGVKVTGVTVHLVDERVDHGPILAQVAVPIEEDDTPARLEERIHCVEHDLYWRCLKDLLEGRFTKTGRRRMRRERP
jgi:phosphoribosylglycinamide formyltransferase-1